MSQQPESIRSVVVTVDHPWPTRGGVDIRNERTVDALGQLGPVAVISVGTTKDLAVVPAEVTDALGWSIAKLASERSKSERVVNRAWYVRPGTHWRYDTHTSRAAEHEARNFALEWRPDIVVASQLPTAPIARVLAASGARLVFDTHNVEARLRSEITPEGSGWRGAFDARRVAQCERRFCNQVDQIWVCSEADARGFVEVHDCTTAVEVVPNTVHVPPLIHPSAADDNRLVFVGSFPYLPNQVAVQELLDDIMPAVHRSSPSAVLDLVGRSPSVEMRALVERASNVDLYADVPDTAPFLARAAAMLVPLRSGSGTRLKILEAMAAGVPVISTPKGIEGIEAVHGVHALIAERSDDLASYALELMKDASQREQIRTAAHTLVGTKYSAGSVRTRVADIATRLLDEPRN